MWLNAKKTGVDSVKIFPVISEAFPRFEEIKNYSRIFDLNYFNEKNKFLVNADSINFFVAEKNNPNIFNCKVQPRDLKFPTSIASHYLKDEIGLTVKEIKNLLKDETDSINENYRRNLKIISYADEKNISDFYTGLEREIVITKFSVNKNFFDLTLKLFGSEQKKNKIRILFGKKSKLIETDLNGEAKIKIPKKSPILFSYIEFWKESSGNFKSIWTNLSLIKIDE